MTTLRELISMRNMNLESYEEWLDRLRRENREMTRTEAIMQALGWQGGTVHQVAEETGLSVETILYGSPVDTNQLSSNYGMGWFAGRTCTVEYNKAINFPKHKGNANFWLGVAEGLIRKAGELQLESAHDRNVRHRMDSYYQCDEPDSTEGE